MLCPTNRQALRTRDRPVLMSHLLKGDLDPGRGDSAQDHFRLLDQAEVEEVHYPDFHFQRRRRVCIRQ